MTRFLIPIPLLLVTMGIGPCGSRRLGSLDAGSGSLDAGVGCDYAGAHREAGSRFPSTDGCNTCSCGILSGGQLVEAGKVYCTQALCLSDAGADNSCRIGLTESGCAATIDLQVQTGFFGLCGLAGPCGTFRVWTTPANYVSLTCVYDSSGQNLFSATSCSDIPVCGGNQFCQYAGESIDIAQACNLSSLPRACSTADGGSVPAVDAGTSGTLRLDCGSRLDRIPEFETHCQRVASDVSMMVCPQTNSAPGSLTVRILQPSAVVLGQPLPLGAGAVASIEVAATTPMWLVETLSPNGTGSIVLDEFSIGGVMRGHFVGAQVQVAPTPVFPCQLSRDEFNADFGPGITGDAGGTAACTPGANQTCNDDPTLNSIHGVCQPDGSCVCGSGISFNPSTGKCL